ncbi:hypothetical protein L2E82_10676 [Cichorium intybus]|uniref:Uncharacterized protein n=1 Tax=Cichorium intybus TaxID=13427 RepID=A0ACB9GB08_CICIN|nr:hypothetical protein L2E82_10676 [Cichorium intybus]
MKIFSFFFDDISTVPHLDTSQRTPHTHNASHSAFAFHVLLEAPNARLPIITALNPSLSTSKQSRSFMS